MLLAWVAGLASAGVTVHDDSGCIDEEALDLELRLALGDAGVDALDVAVDHATDPAGERIGVAVRRGSGAHDLLYARTFPATRVDCPLLPQVVARSIATGLAALPDWARARGRPAEAGLYAYATAPEGLRMGLGSGIAPALSARARLRLDVEGMASTAVRITRQRYALAAGGVAVGPSFRVEPGPLRLDLGARVWGGALVLASPAFRPTPSPHAIAIGDAGLGLGPLLRAALRVEVPITRQNFVVGFGAGEERDLEPPVRVGLAIGFGGVVGRDPNVRRSRDDTAPDRP